MKIHFVTHINPEFGNGYSACGRLIPERYSYDEETPGRDNTTCKVCARKPQRRNERMIQAICLECGKVNKAAKPESWRPLILICDSCNYATSHDADTAKVIFKG